MRDNLSCRRCLTPSPSARRARIEIRYHGRAVHRCASPSARRARIEMGACSLMMSERRCRPPQGGRGLKCCLDSPHADAGGRPPQGGRGLKSDNCGNAAAGIGRPPQGGRGLKLFRLPEDTKYHGRPPQGGRGLKYRRQPEQKGHGQSPSARRARIEIRATTARCSISRVALRKEGAD